MDLRPYQQEQVNQVRQAMHYQQRVLLQCPTGGGKTVIASDIIQRAVDKGSRVLFLAHRRELIFQTQEKLERFGVPAGIVMSDEPMNVNAPVQVASIQTLHRRGIRKDERHLPPADLIVIDEAHRSMSKTYLEVCDHYTRQKGSFLLGLTATPIRGDGKGLGALYEDMILGPSMRELQDQGFLVPIEAYCPSIPDLQSVKIRAGDYVESELGKVMDRADLVGDVIEQWSRICGKRQTVVFASTVAHSRHLCAAFEDVGVRAAHIDGSTPKGERFTILKKLDEGEIQVVCNCMVLTEGWDQPSVKHLVLARPTKSLGLYLQMAGRALRPCPESGFDNMILQDHSGAVYEHGLPDEPIEWYLDDRDPSGESTYQQRKSEPKIITCDNCSHMFSGTIVCPKCGTRVKVHEKIASYVEGDLIQLTRGEELAAEKRYQDKQAAKQQRSCDWLQIARELKHIQQMRGYKNGWVYKTLEAYLKGPLTAEQKQCLSMIEPAQSTPATQRFVNSQLIRYWKGKGKGRKKRAV